MIDKSFPKNFDRSEMLHSNAAVRSGLCNEPTGEDAKFVEINLLRTAEFLQAVRDRLSNKRGKDTPIKILSGYRSPEVNKLVGGSKSSAHMRGLAADIVADGVDNFELAKFIAQEFPIFDQVILEFNNWVHVGLSESHPRNQMLTAKKIDGKTKYFSGFVK